MKGLFSLILILSPLLLGASLFPDQKSPIVTVLPVDAIPAIVKPTFVSADVAKVGEKSPVIGVAFNGEAHAYSMYLLNGREIVNDTVGGVKIATTW